MSLKKNTLYNLLGNIIPIIPIILLLPYILESFGNEKFSLLAIIWVIFTYFGLFDLGIGKALTYEVSKLNNSKKKNGIQETVLAGIFLTILFGLLGTLVFFVLSPIIVTNLIKVSPELLDEAIKSFQICAISIIPTSLMNTLKGAFEGLENFTTPNIVKVVVGITIIVIPGILIYYDFASLIFITTLYLITRIIALAYLFNQLSKIYSLKIKIPKTKYFTYLFNYGSWVTVSGIIGPLMIYGDRFFISGIIGLKSLPFYVIPQEALFRLMVLPISYFSALLPRINYLDIKDFQKTRKKSFNIIFFSMLCVCFLFVVLAYPILSWWISKEFADESILICFIFSIGLLINSLALLPYTHLHARGKTKITAIFHVIELLVYIPLLINLTKLYGLTGASISWVLRLGLDYILLLFAEKRLINYQNLSDE